MSQTQTMQEHPVELPLAVEAVPKPVAGCATCDLLAQDRDRARANGDGSKRADVNVRLSRHLGADH
jgi:hypothetical protein